MKPPVVIGTGTHAVVELDSYTGTVVKRFLTSSPERNAKLAQKEFDHLTAVFTALRAYPFLSCPEPVEVNVLQGTVTMTHCSGSPVSELLKGSTAESMDDAGHIAQQLAVASVVYVSTLRTPYNDMSFKHALYDHESRILSLVDFSGRLRVDAELAKRDPLSASVGVFIGRTVHSLVGLRTMPSQVLWARHRRLVLEVIRCVNALHPVDFEVAQKAAEAVFEDHRASHRDLIRWLWYRSGGKWLYEKRMRSILTELKERPDEPEFFG